MNIIDAGFQFSQFVSEALAIPKLSLETDDVF